MQRRGEWKLFVEEETRRNERRMWVARDAIGEVAVGCVEDDRGNVTVLRREVDGERSADAVAVDDDALRRDMLRGGEIGECGFCVLLHTGLLRMQAGALAITAIVEKQNIQTGVVEEKCAGERI